MKGIRYADEREPREKCQEVVDPELRRSPLAASEGTIVKLNMLDCESCGHRGACLALVIALEPFARPECNASVSAPRNGRHRGTPRTTSSVVLPVVQAHPEGIHVRRIGELTGINAQKIRSALEALEINSQIRVERPARGRNVAGTCITRWGGRRGDDGA